MSSVHDVLKTKYLKSTVFKFDFTHSGNELTKREVNGITRDMLINCQARDVVFIFVAFDQYQSRDL